MSTMFQVVQGTIQAAFSLFLAPLNRSTGVQFRSELTEPEVAAKSQCERAGERCIENKPDKNSFASDGRAFASIPDSVKIIRNDSDTAKYGFLEKFDIRRLRQS